VYLETDISEQRRISDCRGGGGACRNRALAKAVNHVFPIATDRVRAQITSCGIYGVERSTGAGTIDDFCFPY
jgi:hypothetical protein